MARWLTWSTGGARTVGARVGGEVGGDVGDVRRPVGDADPLRPLGRQPRPVTRASNDSSGFRGSAGRGAAGAVDDAERVARQVVADQPLEHRAELRPDQVAERGAQRLVVRRSVWRCRAGGRACRGSRTPRRGPRSCPARTPAARGPPASGAASSPSCGRRRRPRSPRPRAAPRRRTRRSPATCPARRRRGRSTAERRVRRREHHGVLRATLVDRHAGRVRRTAARCTWWVPFTDQLERVVVLGAVGAGARHGSSGSSWTVVVRLMSVPSSPVGEDEVEARVRLLDSVGHADQHAPSSVSSGSSSTCTRSRSMRARGRGSPTRSCRPSACASACRGSRRRARPCCSRTAGP